MAQHPVQPLVEDALGTLRFKSNKIVEFLLENGPYDINALAGMDFEEDDREQFAQLIGVSLGLFADLPYVSEETYNRAEQQIEKS